MYAWHNAHAKNVFWKMKILEVDMEGGREWRKENENTEKKGRMERRRMKDRWRKEGKGRRKKRREENGRQRQVTA